MRQILTELVTRAIEQNFKQGALKISTWPEVVIGIPRSKEHGDYSCNIALQMAKQEKMNPHDIAALLKEEIGDGMVVEQEPRKEGRFLDMVIAPKSQK